MLRALLPILFLATCALAQPPAFEAATIKPSRDTPGHTGTHTRTGMVVMTGHTLKSMICTAYHVKESQVTGGPKWIDEDRFDINAKAEGAAQDIGDDKQLMRMLQTLLADRFQLVFHHEEKIAPTYALVVVKSGLRIKPVEGVTGSNSNGSRGKLTATGVSMEKLAESLSRQLGTPVTNLTGVPGAFDFTLEWSVEGDKNDAESALFAALQSQLGLKLEMRKLPVDLLVIDRAEKPSEN